MPALGRGILPGDVHAWEVQYLKLRRTLFQAGAFQNCLLSARKPVLLAFLRWGGEKGRRPAHGTSDTSVHTQLDTNSCHVGEALTMPFTSYFKC